jgi:hypothetical protein
MSLEQIPEGRPERANPPASARSQRARIARRLMPRLQPSPNSTTLGCTNLDGSDSPSKIAQKRMGELESADPGSDL